MRRAGFRPESPTASMRTVSAPPGWECPTRRAGRCPVQEAQLRDSEGAVRYLERAVEIYSKYTEALNNLGTHYHRAGNYPRSIEYFTKVTELDPRFFAGWVNLGGSLLAAGKFESALEANQKAVQLRPDEALANSQMGMNYFYLRRFPEAKIYFTKAVTLDPYSAKSPQFFLAHIAFAERRPDEAENQIRQYLELHPFSQALASGKPCKSRPRPP